MRFTWTMVIVLAVVVIFLFYGSTETVIREGLASSGNPWKGAASMSKWPAYIQNAGQPSKNTGDGGIFNRNCIAGGKSPGADCDPAKGGSDCASGLCVKFPSPGRCLQKLGDGGGGWSTSDGGDSGPPPKCTGATPATARYCACAPSSASTGPSPSGLVDCDFHDSCAKGKCAPTMWGDGSSDVPTPCKDDSDCDAVFRPKDTTDYYAKNQCLPYDDGYADDKKVCAVVAVSDDAPGGNTPARKSAGLPKASGADGASNLSCAGNLLFNIQNSFSSYNPMPDVFAASSPATPAGAAARKAAGFCEAGGQSPNCIWPGPAEITGMPSTWQTSWGGGVPGDGNINGDGWTRGYTSLVKIAGGSASDLGSRGLSLGVVSAGASVAGAWTFIPGASAQATHGNDKLSPAGLYKYINGYDSFKGNYKGGDPPSPWQKGSPFWSRVCGAADAETRNPANKCPTGNSWTISLAGDAGAGPWYLTAFHNGTEVGRWESPGGALGGGAPGPPQANQLYWGAPCARTESHFDCSPKTAAEGQYWIYNPGKDFCWNAGSETQFSEGGCQQWLPKKGLKGNTATGMLCMNICDGDTSNGGFTKSNPKQMDCLSPAQCHWITMPTCRDSGIKCPTGSYLRDISGTCSSVVLQPIGNPLCNPTDQTNIDVCCRKGKRSLLQFGETCAEQGDCKSNRCMGSGGGVCGMPAYGEPGSFKGCSCGAALCECSNGTPAGLGCTVPGQTLCSSCSSGYKLAGGKCFSTMEDVTAKYPDKKTCSLEGYAWVGTCVASSGSGPAPPGPAPPGPAPPGPAPSCRPIYGAKNCDDFIAADKAAAHPEGVTCATIEAQGYDCSGCACGNQGSGPSPPGAGNVCTCPHGTPVTGSACTVNNAAQCLQCDSGYKLSSGVGSSCISAGAGPPNGKLSGQNRITPASFTATFDIAALSCDCSKGNCTCKAPVK